MSTSDHVAMYEAVASLPDQISQCADILSAVANSPVGCGQLKELAKSPVRRVICCGMGGSAFPMDMMRSFLTHPSVLSVHRDYGDALVQVEADTLYLLLSFSGNTEEVLDCANSLKASNAKTVAVTTGGALGAWAVAESVLHVPFPSLPGTFQPRCATGFFLGLVGGLLDRLQIDTGLVARMAMAFESLKSRRGEIEAEADRLSEYVAQRKIIMLSYEPLASMALRVARIKFNENAKRLTIVDALPEFNHNQMVALGGDVDAIGVVLVSPSVMSKKRQKRWEVFADVLRAEGYAVYRLALENDCLGMDVLETVWMMDFCSLRLAVRDDVNPQEIEFIERFKGALRDG